ncbi:MAG: serine hydrolase, partial [Longimicrobiales bacterium]|nr:serine hydrolase [Longimicrobiales bacterium]
MKLGLLRRGTALGGRWQTAAAVALGACLAAAPVAAQEPHREILAGKLQDQLRQIASDVPGVLGIQVVDLTSGERFGVNEQLVFPQGSAIKVAVLVELYKQAAAGTLRVEEQVAITKAAAVSGSQLQYFKDGTSSLSLHDLAVLMIIVSDNMATNLLIDRVGMDNVNRTMVALGLPNTKLQRKMIRPEESARGNENLSTPQEAAALMVRIFKCELP